MFVVSKRSDFGGGPRKWLTGATWTDDMSKAEVFVDDEYAAMIAGDWGDYYSMKDMGWHTKVEGIEQ